MSLDAAEFFRLVPTALDRYTYVTTPNCIIVADSDRQVRIELSPQPELRIASLSLPRTSVELAFDGYSAEAATHFVERFLRHYQRGGG